MMPDPRLGSLEILLVASLGNQIQVVVGGVQHIDAAGVARVGVENCAVLVFIEHTDSLSLGGCLLAFRIIVERFAAVDLLLSEGHMVVLIEIAIP